MFGWFFSKKKLFQTEKQRNLMEYQDSRAFREFREFPEIACFPPFPLRFKKASNNNLISRQ